MEPSAESWYAFVSGPKKCCGQNTYTTNFNFCLALSGLQGVLALDCAAPPRTVLHMYVFSPGLMRDTCHQGSSSVWRSCACCYTAQSWLSWTRPLAPWTHPLKLRCTPRFAPTAPPSSLSVGVSDSHCIHYYSSLLCLMLWSALHYLLVKRLLWTRG